MTIAQPGVIDIIGQDLDANTILLVISDHLDWENELEHLERLQAKLNCDLGFIESGQLAEEYPAFVEPEIRIEVCGQDEPSDTARQFMQETGKIVAEAGYSLSFRRLRQ